MDAELVVLFRHSIGNDQAAIVRELAGLDSLTEIDDADLHAWVSPAGELDFLVPGRHGPLWGEPILQGRLWHAYLPGRYWTDRLRDYGGNPIAYARSVDALRVQTVAAVGNVWYGTHLREDGTKELAQVVANDFT